MKFGKYLEGRQLELSEYNGHFIDYKGLKKLIKQLAIPVFPNNSHQSKDLILDKTEDSDDDVTDFNNPVFYTRLQENKASFFFRLERELEKVNSFYLEKEADLKVQFNILQIKYNNYKRAGRLNSRMGISFKTIYGGFIKFQKDLSNFEQYVELNKTGFSKVLKKWDKRSHSQEKEFYLATVVSVQPIFARNEALRLNDETLNILIELNDVNNNNNNSNTGENEPITNSEKVFGMNDEILPNSTMSSDNKTMITQNLTVLNLRPSPITNDSQTSLDYLDWDTKIENWYIELVNISKLKDDYRRNIALTNFTTTKIQNTIGKIDNVDKPKLLKQCVSRLFLLLIGSSITDTNLQIFYDSSKGNIDLLYNGEDEEEFTKRNIIHEAMHSPKQQRTFIVKTCMEILSLDTLTRLINEQDIYKRTPLHYAADLGKLDSLEMIINSGLDQTIDNVDNNSKTPLILAIINNHNDIVKFLLIHGNASVIPKSNQESGVQFSPLCVACKYNNYDAVDLILKLRDDRGIKLNDRSDPEAAESLHIVTKNNGDSKLLQLLIEHGANPNGIDNFNKWTPIFYAIQQGQASSVKLLLDLGARLDVVDEDSRSPLFYVLWDSHTGVLNAILPFINEHNQPRTLPNATLAPVTDGTELVDDLDGLSPTLEHIPDFELPPPIIPLRKYGHNFLEKKIFIKLVFKGGAQCINFTNNDTLELTQPGRMTITPNFSSMIPRNLIFSESESTDYDESKTKKYETTFLIDTLDKFSIDFEIFASFGTRLLAKTTAMSHFFTHDPVSSIRTVTLSLFDTRLNCVGSLDLEYQVILPYLGKPLQITKYEPYWKSTGNNNNNNNNQPGIMSLDNQLLIANKSVNTVQSTIVTSSSLSGTFISIKVFALNDGTIVSAPSFYIDVYGSTVLINDLTKPQLETLCGYKIDKIETDIFSSFGDNIEEIYSFFKKVISSKVFEFETLLKAIPKSIQLIVQVCFPTAQEIESVPVKISPCVTINKFIDGILYIIFEHERTLRHSGQSIRSIVFSSCNWQACSILNWKQPNFPVLLRMNTLSTKDGSFISDTPHRLKVVSMKKNCIEVPIYDENANNDTAAIIKPDGFDEEDNDGPIHIHDMVRFSISNNLLGVIIPYELLKLSDTLNSVIKGQELLLIGSSHDNNDLMKEDKEINGRYYDAELIFD